MAKKLDVSVPRLVSLVLEGLATEWENDKEDVESTLRSLCLKYK